MEKDALIKEAYQRIQLLTDRVKKARDDENYNLVLLQSWITIYEDLAGKKLPKNVDARASRALSRRASVPEAVFELMRSIDSPLHLNIIVERLFSEGFRTTVKKPKEQIRIALIRGAKRGIYKRVAGNTFIVDPSVRKKSYRELRGGE